MSLLDSNGCSPLHYAAKNGFLNGLQKLLSSGARVCQRDNYGFTALHYAAQSPPDLALAVSIHEFYCSLMVVTLTAIREVLLNYWEMGCLLPWHHFDGRVRCIGEF